MFQAPALVREILIFGGPNVQVCFCGHPLALAPSSAPFPSRFVRFDGRRLGIDDQFGAIDGAAGGTHPR